MSKLSKKQKKRFPLWIGVLILIFVFYLFSYVLSPVFYFALFQPLLEKVTPTPITYIIDEKDTIKHTKHMGNDVQLTWDMNVHSVGEQTEKSNGWKGEWRITFTQKGKFTTTYTIPSLYIPPFRQDIDSAQTLSISLAGMSEGQSYTKNKTKVTLLRDNGSEGALIQIDYDLTPEQEAQVKRVDNLYQGTSYTGWGTIATTVPSVQLLIRRPDTVTPTPQVIH